MFAITVCKLGELPLIEASIALDLHNVTFGCFEIGRGGNIFNGGRVEEGLALGCKSPVLPGSNLHGESVKGAHRVRRY